MGASSITYFKQVDQPLPSSMKTVAAGHVSHRRLDYLDYLDSSGADEDQYVHLAYRDQ